MKSDCYFCDVPTCVRKIFAERLTPFIEPRARVTRRLYQIVQIIGLADFRKWGSASWIDWGYKLLAGQFFAVSWLFPPYELSKCHSLA